MVMMKKILIYLPLIFLYGCAAIVGENSKSSIALPITIIDAENIAREHLEQRNMLWGEPISTGQMQGKYYFGYFTPDRESSLISGRRLIVDMYTGEVSFPLRM